MSILIKGMEMPTRCLACQMNYDSCACILTGSRFYKYNTEFDPGEERLPDCPLVPVPPHGRLGDLDELYAHLNEWYLTNKSAFTKKETIYIRAMLLGIVDAPTIIPAESGERDD